MTKELVIAKYDKNVSWIQDIKSDVTITIYNKNIKNLQDGDIVIHPNVGRCVHTFFYHIVKNYNTLADLTFFSQDYPFDHIPNYIDVINNEKLLEDYIYKSGDGYFINAYWSKEKPAVTPFMYCDKYGYPQQKTIKLNIEKSWKTIFEKSQIPVNSNDFSFKYYEEYYKNMLQNNIKKTKNSILSSFLLNQCAEIRISKNDPIFEFVPGGHYAVTKEKIYQKNINFYKKNIRLFEC